MKMFLILVLVFCTNIFADKLKSASYGNNVTYTKLLLSNPMYLPERAKKLGEKQEYIKSINMFADGELILKIKITPYLSRNPLIKLAQKNIDAKKLSLEYVDNYEKVKKFEAKIRRRKRDFEFKEYEKVIYTPSLRVSEKIEDAKFGEIAEIFGDVKFFEKDMYINVPELASNGGSVPLIIRPNVDVKSLSVFTTMDNEMKLVCRFFPQEKYNILEYNLKFKMKESSFMQVIIEDKKGKFYKIKKYIFISLGGGDP